MFLFLISFLLVFISSYFITSVISPKKSILGLIYIFLIAFAQIVLTFEVLSLFTLIKQVWVLGANTLFLFISLYFWNKKYRPIWILDCSDFKNKLINSLKLDKSLMWLYVGFLTLLISAFTLCLLFPITSADASAYHVARSLFWVLQGSLNHFDVADVRNLCLPINSEILYSWVILFTRKVVFLGFFSYVGYLLSIISIYNIFGFMGYCVRKRLWVIFILSSMSSVLVQLSGTETDIIIAGLISSCIFLFWYALRNNDKTPLFMSSLAYALAIGTKTTSIIAMPGVGLFLFALCVYFKKYKPISFFLGFGIINFLIFSSYNYILNSIQFSNFMGPTSFMVVSKNYYGIKGAISNFIKYIFAFFDFTGFKWADYVNNSLESLRNIVLNFFHLGDVEDGLYSFKYTVNRTLIEPLMGAGVLGFLVFLPTLLWSLFKPIVKRKSRKSWFIFSFSILFLINILVLSFSLAYMPYSVRFIMTFIVLSSPVILYSYFSKRNPLKYIIVVFSLFYLMIVSTHLWARPFFKVAPILIEHHSVTYLRDLAECKNFDKTPSYLSALCILKTNIKSNVDKQSKLLVFVNAADPIYTLKSLELEGYQLDFRTLEDSANINFDNYDIVISPSKNQTATLIKKYNSRKSECKIIKGKIIIDRKSLVPCLYVPNRNLKRVKTKESTYPYQVVCAIRPEFLAQKHLKYVGTSGLINLDLEEISYRIYVNTNRIKK